MLYLNPEILVVETPYGRSSHRSCSVKKVFLKVSHISLENTSARGSFLIKSQEFGRENTKKIKYTAASWFSTEEISKDYVFKKCRDSIKHVVNLAKI